MFAGICYAENFIGKFWVKIFCKAKYSKNLRWKCFIRLGPEVVKNCFGSTELRWMSSSEWPAQHFGGISCRILILVLSSVSYNRSLKDVDQYRFFAWKKRSCVAWGETIVNLHRHATDFLCNQHCRNLPLRKITQKLAKKLLVEPNVARSDAFEPSFGKKTCEGLPKPIFDFQIWKKTSVN